MDVTRRVFASLLSIARNAVPAAGVLAREWAPPNALLLYLGENVVLVLLAALTVRFLSPAEEMIEGKLKSRGDSLRAFFLVAVPFTFGAAVFTFAVIAIRDEYEIDTPELFAGFAMMLVFQVIAFAVGLSRLRGITLAESESLLVSVLGRVFLLALGVWAGLILAFFVSAAFVIPFVILKTIVDLASLRPAALKRRLLAGV